MRAKVKPVCLLKPVCAECKHGDIGTYIGMLQSDDIRRQGTLKCTRLKRKRRVYFLSTCEHFEHRSCPW